MNKPVKIILIGVGILLTLNYLKKRKSEKPSIKQIEEKKMSASDLNLIRINLLEYIETRNSDMGVSKTREDIDYDIMLITNVKK